MWSLPAMDEIGLASIVMSDGPVGVRGTRWSADDPSVALPSPTALAATWDPALARAAGRLLGQEARRKGVHVLLAPTVNLHRSPLGGRHFEAYSEDPLLTAAIGTGYVRGVQDQGVAATVKHFVANDFETERFTASAEVSERALRELYLAPFEAIVRDAGAWAVMSAYNAVNGVTMTTNGALQLGVLKDEWGFDGVVVSDWLAAHDTVGTANGGPGHRHAGDGQPVGRPAGRRGARRHGPARGHRRAGTPGAAARRQGRRAGRCAEAVPPDTGRLRADGAALARDIAVRSFVLASNRDRRCRSNRRPLQRRADRRAGQARQGARRRQRDGLPRACHLAAGGAVRGAAGRVTLRYAVGADPRAQARPRRRAAVDRPARHVQGRGGRHAARDPAGHRRRPVDGAASGRRARRPDERGDLRPADRRRQRRAPPRHPRHRQRSR